ncbi:MAG TPA: PepSY domain-containing protein [Virgibacillus sp.]|nr:PepSY domain-containing protein [Virgibacillus sp.]
MKKKLIVTIGAVVCAVGLGVGIYQSDASAPSPNLSVDQIEQMVSDQYPGTITEIELEKEYNQLVYEVDIEDDGKKYELKLDANSGEVLKLEEKVKSTKQEKMALNDDEQDEQKEKQSDQKATNKEKESDAPAKSSTKDEQKTVIDVHDAVEFALKEFTGTVTEIELDEDDGRFIYEIEIKSGNEKAEFDIDVYTGEILSIEIENKRKQQLPDESKLIHVNEAIDIALNEFSGTITDLELDKDDGRYIYEIDIQSGHEEVELDIDAYTGKILSIEIDD